MAQAKRWSVVSRGLVTLLTIALCLGCGDKPEAAKQPVPKVTVTPVVSQETTDYDEYIGRTEASEIVEVRARVFGYLKSVEFKDGDYVEKGKKLFTIEEDEYDAINKVSLSRIDLAKTRHDLATKTVARKEPLVKSGAVTRQEYDEDLAKVEEALAGIKAAEADANRTAVDLKHTELFAPISGRIDRAFVTPGNLLTGGMTNGTLLTKIVNEQPMHVYFDVDERSLLRYMKMRAENAPGSLRGAQWPCYVQLADEQDFSHEGVLDFASSEVNASTGTARIRAEFKNEDRVLASGLFVRVRIPLSKESYAALVVPERALATDLSIKYVYVVGSDRKAERRNVQLGRQVGELRIITGGLKEGEEVITKGVQRVKPDQDVEVERAAAASPDSTASKQERELVAKFFIDRPIFAAVISVIITLAGGIAVGILPVAQYPEITPPTVQVTCFYPGASAKVVADTVAAPIEQQVIGVENMLYMSSQSTNDGGYNLTVTFEVGTNLDMAQVLVQNRVNLALPSLPSEVKQTGVSVKKKSPNILLVVNLVSPKGSYDQLYLSNYATIQIRDELAQIKGVGDVTYLGQLDYSMRAWLDPDRMAARDLSASDVAAALREQNVQVAAGALGRPPVPQGQDFQYTLSTLGRLTDPTQFGNIVVKTGQSGDVTRLRDLVTDERKDEHGQRFGGIQLGAKTEDTSCSLDGKPSIGLGIFQQPGSNALVTADSIQKRMDELKLSFPPDLDYAIVYDTTPFIAESIKEVFKALRDAIILVAIVVLAFLQSWRATVIPLIAVPVAIVGTFAVMLGMGFSLNNLSLFGLVLAIGIVVDDAIVVVEAVEHHLEHGLSARDAAVKAMSEVTGPIIAISLVLMCVFIPCAFITGITGQFFRQFALTIAVSTFFSAVNSLTLSPALCALLLKPKDQQRDPLTWVINLALGWFFKLFNSGFQIASDVYSRSVGMLLRVSVIVLAVYGGLLYLTYYGFTAVPTGFIPSQDKGYLLVDVRLPDSASLERTQAVMAQVEKICRGAGSASHGEESHSEHGHDGEGIPGIGHTIAISGQSIVQNAIGSNYGTVYVVLDEFHHRHGSDMGADAIASKLRAACYREVQEANVAVFGAPAVDGLGSAGGFKVMVRDASALGLDALQSAADQVAQEGNGQPELVGLFSAFRSQTPQMYVDIDRERCKAIGLPLNEVFLTLQLYLGGYYTNDFNQFGRTWQVNLQGDPQYRLRPDQVRQLKVRNSAGEMVPLGSVAAVSESGGPALVIRYNGITAAAVNGGSRPGVSSGNVIQLVEGVAARELPQGMNLQWTELTLLQIRAGNTAIIVFAVAVVLVFLVLAAQYESLSLPMAVILVVPMCLLCSVVGVAMAGMDINIFVQIGFVVLVGLAAKNAILIVEFAKEKSAQGATPEHATVEACRLRLRPIIMTSLAFILGVVPLALAVGAGAEMRSTLGIAVFSGMLGVTIFGIFLTPVFYYLVVRLFGKQVSPAPVQKELKDPHGKDPHGKDPHSIEPAMSAT